MSDELKPEKSIPEYCDVALPVPLDMVFTYRVTAEVVPVPVVGGRVLVQFRQQRLTGIVVELHDRKPSVKIKPILNVLDATPVLDEQLLRLGRWIADYYLAPLGEVFRTMLPLASGVQTRSGLSNHQGWLQSVAPGGDERIVSAFAEDAR